MKALNVLYNLPKELFLLMLKRRGLKVGKNFYCGQGVVLDSSFCWLIKIGSDVTLADQVYVLAHDSSTKHFVNYTRIGKVVIGNRVFIGAASLVLPGVTIGDDVVIGAGSVVTHDIPSGSVARGNPANVTQTIDHYITRRKEEIGRYPVFGEEYTVTKRINSYRRFEMNEKMKDKYGFVF